MKARGRFVSLLMALVCLLPLGASLIGFGDSASAATPEEINVTLHKKKMDEFPNGGIKNTGEEMNVFNQYDPLPGVEFTVYDVTKDFYKLLKATGNETETVYNANVKKLMEGFELSQAPDAVEKTKGVTDNQGEVTFKLEDRDENGTYKVYLFSETLPADTNQFSQPVILMLPVYKSDQSVNKDVHLYPKNRVENEPTKEVVGDDWGDLGDEERYTYDVGKKINYKASFRIPSQIGEILKNDDGSDKQTRYTKLVFSDQVNKEGIKFEGIDRIEIDGKNKKDEITQVLYSTLKGKNDGVDDPYAATGKYAGFELKFNLSADLSPTSGFKTSKTVAEYLSNYAGKKIEFFYSVSFTEDTEVDVDIENNFTVGMDHDGESDNKSIDDKPIVTTGGKKFMKHDSLDDAQGLKGAEFMVIKVDKGNGTRKYLKNKTGVREWAAYTVGQEPADALKVVSNEKGLFEIAGIEYGDYELVETKAPDGFVKSDQPIDFIVDKDSYGKIDAFKEGMVPNTSRGGFLPSTGGIGIVIFLLIGGALMSFAVIRYRKTQHAA
ncbi:SpaH/EbpB family LPXTG-anchored major pilin [Enterococcus hulanensis]|uniref:SpaH/EbpB family LPXTG-anchored major pilin n=1 Tax=Enterococcus hulanensis TaxID=2559929 RepID=UPI001A8D81D3|nr:SpaH/EbpB family LPXTG-anchored major pilin [Enterococcus hulanensis]MBO0455366.1 SpaH/EbpB family LPXTG-anchored major pilin [Enterococcus hulanensis]